MKKLFLLGILLSGFLHSQDKSEEILQDSLKHWSVQGQNTLMLNQAAFSNWIGGGANNVGWIAGSNYNMTYEKGNDLLENIVILGYGQNNTKGLGNRKTQDIINLSSNYGRKISKNWYVSAGASLLTQFDAGYESSGSKNLYLYGAWLCEYWYRFHLQTK